MAPVIERITSGAILAEAPYWDVRAQVLYFLDIFGKTLNRYDPATKTETKVSIAPDQASFIIPVKGQNNQFVTGFGDSVAIVTWDGQSDKISNVKKLDSVESPLLFNDGKVDSTGRLWAGTSNFNLEDLYKTEARGSLYSFGSDRKLRVQLKDIKISNGLDWNDKIGKMYYTDSLKFAVNQYDLDLESGTLSNEQVLFDFKKNNVPGFPDGLTIDSDGNLWVAVFDGNRVIQIDGQKPETLLQTIELPAQQVTSVAFGGENLDELYVTTGSVTNKGVRPEPPVNGATYRVTGLGVTGLPPNDFVLPPL